jgi:hypothetical protein
MHLFPMSRLLPTAIAFLVGVGAAFPANAAPKEGGKHQTNPLVKEYLMLDSDGDGKIMEAEVLTDRSEKFKELDADGDGAITLEEVRRIFESEVPAETSEGLRKRGIDDLSILFIDSMDANDDGQVDLVEFQRPARERFRQIDANSDGFATPGETTVFFSKIRF